MGARNWTDSEVAKLRRLYPDHYNRDLTETFRRSETAIQLKARKLGLRKSGEFMASNPGCFKPGQEPWNKGQPHNPPGSEVGRFIKGQEPPTRKPLGSERPGKDGVLYRKVAETRVKAINWRPVHHLIYERHFGDIPEGHMIIFRDGNNRNFEPSNLECITRAENMRRNSVQRLPDDLRLAVQMLGVLNRKIREANHG